jgi:hypothetical protein
MTASYYLEAILVIGSDYPLKLATRYTDIHDNNGVRHRNQPFLVLEQASFEDWVNECLNDGLDISYWLNDPATINAHFYRIALD